jgi:predicted phosphodiesterase
MPSEKILKRFFLVSDMHYSVETDDIEKYSSMPDVKVSVAAGDALGHTQKEVYGGMITGALVAITICYLWPA